MPASGIWERVLVHVADTGDTMAYVHPEVYIIPKALVKQPRILAQPLGLVTALAMESPNDWVVAIGGVGQPPQLLRGDKTILINDCDALHVVSIALSSAGVAMVMVRSADKTLALCVQKLVLVCPDGRQLLFPLDCVACQSCIAWHGSVVAIGDAQGKIWIVDVADFGFMSRCVDRGACTALAFAQEVPDARLGLYVACDQELWMIRIGGVGGAPSALLFRGDEVIRSLQAVDDGVVVYASPDREELAQPTRPPLWVSVRGVYSVDFHLTVGNHLVQVDGSGRLVVTVYICNGHFVVNMYRLVTPRLVQPSVRHPIELR